jgi:hypothetical protein
MDPRIQIRILTKMSWIRNTGKNPVLQEEEEEKVEPQGRSDEPIIKDKSKGKKSKAAAKAGTGIVAFKLSVLYIHRKHVEHSLLQPEIPTYGS